MHTHKSLKSRKLRRIAEAPEGAPSLDEFKRGLETAMKTLEGMRALKADLSAKEDLSQDIDTAVNVKLISGFPDLDAVILSMLENGDLGTSTFGSDHQIKTAYNFILSNSDEISFNDVYSVLSAASKKYFSRFYSGIDLSAPPEAPEDSDPPFGKYAFAPQRKDNVPPEENTSRESAALAGLRAHVRQNDPLPQDVALDLMKALEAGSYSKVIHEPQKGTIYRGIAVDMKGLSELTGERGLEDSGSKVIKRKIRPNPRGEWSSSWTTDIKVAYDFAEHSPESPFSVILIAKLDDNPNVFMEGPDGFYNVKELDYHSREKEAIALGQVRLHKLYWRKGAVPTLDQEDMNESVRLLRALVKETILLKRAKKN